MHPLAGAKIVLIVDSSIIAITDSLGTYSLFGVCMGSHDISCTLLGYSAKQEHITLSKDAVLDFSLHEDEGQFSEVTVVAKKQEDLRTVTQVRLNSEHLFQTRGSTLGESLKSIAGLNSIQTGPSLSKPVIHGLHSNRVLIVNNGVRQEGQQWGSEHAPEIDPFTAEHITVIKGAASIRYGSDAIAGVLLLDPPALSDQPGLKGTVYTVGSSNGGMGNISTMLENTFGKRLSGLSIRLQGTLKRAGNFKTANYYLKNTGLFEGDFSALASYKWKKLESQAFFSRYYTKIGIFEGSHVGNIQDLYASFKRDKPSTPSYFSYDIGRSYQSVRHDIYKFSNAYHFINGDRLEAVFSEQKDLRNEYDIDLPYTTNPDELKLPQISFQLKTSSIDLLYLRAQRNGFSGSYGIAGSTQGNVFKGIRYLVPNFRNYAAGAFVIEKYEWKHMLIEAGLRYDYKWLRVYQRSPTTLNTYYSTFDYSNPTATIGATYKVSNSFRINANLGSAWRAPSINELYIRGIHLSAASYEIGDSSLKSERSLNLAVSFNYHTSKASVTLDIYDNEINGFIYAKPTLQPVTLISGTYPAFQYTQDNVSLKGIDLTLEYNLSKRLAFDSKTSIVRGWNKSLDDHLIFMPSDRFLNGFTYHVDSINHLLSPYITIENLSVSRQIRVPPNSDYVAPPAGYCLFNASIGCNIAVCRHLVSLNFSVQNLTNQSYRDYLDRFRYYSDDPGINFILRAKFSF